MTPTDFMRDLANLHFDNVFNPYVDCCGVHDLGNAPARRYQLLLSILNIAAVNEIDSIWIGRDLGYRGGRRTGLALTDEKHVTVHAARWGVHCNRLTSGAMVSERTASVIWDVLGHVSERVFLWNVFPLHPHDPGEPFTNRAHNSAERKVGEEILAALITLLRPRRIIGIGNDAAISALKISSAASVIKVRHPSYGGQSDFLAAMDALYGPREVIEQQFLLDF